MVYYISLSTIERLGQYLIFSVFFFIILLCVCVYFSPVLTAELEGDEGSGLIILGPRLTNLIFLIWKTCNHGEKEWRNILIRRIRSTGSAAAEYHPEVVIEQTRIQLSDAGCSAFAGSIEIELD